MKWSLPQLSDSARVRHDPEFEQIAASLANHYQSEFPRIERLVPASLGHIGLSYQPIVRYMPDERGAGLRDFPQLQLGPGVFTVNQSGRDYEFEDFKQLVATHLAAFHKVSEQSRREAVKPVQFGFVLLNRFDLTEWDTWCRSRGEAPDSPTLASQFLRDTLRFKFKTPYGEIPSMRIHRQELSQTFDLGGDTGRLILVARDASEAPDKQVVTFDQLATTPEGATGLDASPGGVTTWLERARGYTKQVFLNLRSRSVKLNDYLLDDSIPPS